MVDKIISVIEGVKDSKIILEKYQATLGFDGFIDCIVHVIKNKKSKTEFTFFQNMEEFGSYIASHKGKSCTLELKEHVTKIGGNMPILAAALGRLNVKVNCIGPMGYPEIKSQFNSMTSDNCTLYSIGEPGYTSALEFNDGKVMLAKMGSVDDITWDSIKSHIGIDKLMNFFQQSDLLGIVNWSEVENSSDVWEGILSEIMPYHSGNKNQIMYFDLADCSKRYKDDIMYALNLIREFSKHYKVILGMNENESKLVYEALYSEYEDDNLTSAGSKMFEKLGVDILIIHPRDCAIAWDNNGCYRVNNLFIDEPKISTGGGDNFNAGFCIGQLLRFNVDSCLILGNAVSGFYVKNGHSPDNERLIEFLVEWKEKMEGLI